MDLNNSLMNAAYRMSQPVNSDGETQGLFKTEIASRATNVLAGVVGAPTDVVTNLFIKLPVQAAVYFTVKPVVCLGSLVSDALGEFNENQLPTLSSIMETVLVVLKSVISAFFTLSLGLLTPEYNFKFLDYMGVVNNDADNVHAPAPSVQQQTEAPVASTREAPSNPTAAPSTTPIVTAPRAATTEDPSTTTATTTAPSVVPVVAPPAVETPIVVDVPVTATPITPVDVPVTRTTTTTEAPSTTPVIAPPTGEVPLVDVPVTATTKTSVTSPVSVAQPEEPEIEDDEQPKQPKQPVNLLPPVFSNDDVDTAVATTYEEEVVARNYCCNLGKRTRELNSTILGGIGAGASHVGSALNRLLEVTRVKACLNRTFVNSSKAEKALLAFGTGVGVGVAVGVYTGHVEAGLGYASNAIGVVVNSVAPEGSWLAENVVPGATTAVNFVSGYANPAAGAVKDWAIVPTIDALRATPGALWNGGYSVVSAIGSMFIYPKTALKHAIHSDTSLPDAIFTGLRGTVVAAAEATFFVAEGAAISSYVAEKCRNQEPVEAASYQEFAEAKS